MASNHLALAKAYDKLRNFSEAKTELQATIRLDSSDASARFLMYRIYMQLGTRQAAQAELAAFKKLDRFTGRR